MARRICKILLIEGYKTTQVELKEARREGTLEDLTMHSGVQPQHHLASSAQYRAARR